MEKQEKLYMVVGDNWPNEGKMNYIFGCLSSTEDIQYAEFKDSYSSAEGYIQYLDRNVPGCARHLKVVEVALSFEI